MLAERHERTEVRAQPLDERLTVFFIELGKSFSWADVELSNLTLLFVLVIVLDTFSVVVILVSLSNDL